MAEFPHISATYLKSNLKLFLAFDMRALHCMN